MSWDKNELRIEMRNRRKVVSNREEKNRLIYRKLKRLLQRWNVKSAFIYVSFGTEVDTHEIITNLIQSGKVVCVPYTHGGIMSVKVLDFLPKNFFTDKHGNIEDVSELANASFRCDCAIVPMLAFNDGLYRLGYGGGYYDRFLRNFDGKKIGIAFDEEYSNDFKENGTDVGLDIIITPEKMFEKNFKESL